MRSSLCWLVIALTGCGAAQSAGGTGVETVKLIAKGDQRELRKRPEGSPARSADKPPILYIAFDGVGRDILYPMLRGGELPNLAALLGGAEGGKLPHAHLDERMLSTMPSSTMAAWVTTMTGLAPGEHGVMGNEYFVRESRTFACPAPVSFESAAPTLQIYTDGYLDALHQAPTVYERMREKDPNLLAWVAMQFVYRGADKLLLAKKSVIGNAFEGFIEVQEKKKVEDKESRRLYAELDNAVIGVTIDNLDKGPLPDVLTVYLSGTDLYAHIADEGPDKARRAYLKEVVDPHLGRLAAKLRERNALEGRFVVVSADHGHTEVARDKKNALGSHPDKGPPAVLRESGFRVRPFRREVSEKDDFSAVLAYGGATAYVYVADRSQCAKAKDVCDWSKPPRYEEDVLAAADAFWKANRDGTGSPELRGAIDLVLTRRPKPYEETDAPFEVYVGEGKTTPIGAYLAAHPHPSFISAEERLKDLAVGRHGERAGDVMLIAQNPEAKTPAERFYFAGLYRSWHGSPSKSDSEIPFIVAHPTEPIAPIAAWITTILGDRPFQQKVTDVLLGLRESAWKK